MVIPTKSQQHPNNIPTGDVVQNCLVCWWPVLSCSFCETDHRYAQATRKYCNRNCIIHMGVTAQATSYTKTLHSISCAMTTSHTKALHSAIRIEQCTWESPPRSEQHTPDMIRAQCRPCNAYCTYILYNHVHVYCIYIMDIHIYGREQCSLSTIHTVYTVNVYCTYILYI